MHTAARNTERLELSREPVVRRLFPGVEFPPVEIEEIAFGERAHVDVGDRIVIRLPRLVEPWVRAHEIGHALVWLLVDRPLADAAPDAAHEVAAMFLEALMSPGPVQRYSSALPERDTVAWLLAMRAHARGASVRQVVVDILSGAFHGGA